VANPESVGKPISPVIDVRIVTGAGNDASIDEVGEIWLKGPTIVRGYLGRERETAEAFTDGWFHTGDLGRLDADGNLYVVDRLKDVIIRGGENIYAAEVEAALYEHADVTEAAIIGVPDERLGEAVGAVVRTREGSTLREDDVRAHVAARLAAFKVPAHVWITDEELPATRAAKCSNASCATVSRRNHERVQLPRASPRRCREAQIEFLFAVNSGFVDVSGRAGGSHR
jgi:long-chain acyl-CoA synthetase